MFFSLIQTDGGHSGGETVTSNAVEDKIIITKRYGHKLLIGLSTCLKIQVIRYYETDYSK